MQTSVKVYCRFRPVRQLIPSFESANLPSNSTLFSNDETPDFLFYNTQGSVNINSPLDESCLPHTIQIKTASKVLHTASLDCIFPPSCTQSDVYKPVEELVDGLFSGFNATIFSYGLSGSGKTYSLFGPSLQSFNDPSLMGIFPRAVHQIFSSISDHLSLSSSTHFQVGVSILEIYRECLSDLLNKNSEPLAIREDNSRGVYVQNLTVHYVSSSQELLNTVSNGLKQRISASTRMNASSSRSHVVVVVSITKTVNDPITGTTVVTSRLNISDLAGSERVSRTECEGVRLEEAKKINLSLSTLGNVIRAIVDKNPHVPYRESKLTLCLRDSLGGNSKCLVVVNCSMDVDDCGETISSLQFASRVAKVQNFVKINKTESVESLTRQLSLANHTINEQELYISLLKQFMTSVEPNWELLFENFIRDDSIEKRTVPHQSNLIDSEVDDCSFSESVSCTSDCAPFSDTSANHSRRLSETSSVASFLKIDTTSCQQCSDLVERLRLERAQADELRGALVKALQNKTKQVADLELARSSSSSLHPLSISNTSSHSPLSTISLSSSPSKSTSSPSPVAVKKSVTMSDPISIKPSFVQKKRSGFFSIFSRDASPSSDDSTSHVALSGHLLKKTQKKKWKERYFVLYRDSAHLSYFHDKKDKIPAATYLLGLGKGAKITTIKDQNHEFCFQINLPDDDEILPLILSAASVVIMTKWIQTIQLTVRNVVNRCNPPTPLGVPSPSLPPSFQEFTDKSGWVFLLSSSGTWLKRFITLTNGQLIISDQSCSILSPGSSVYTLHDCTVDCERGGASGFFQWSVVSQAFHFVFAVESGNSRDDWMAAFQSFST
ncbi:hypothetical protein RCL1_002462 [Eukaryota sp. TZLM3-RCL]